MRRYLAGFVGAYMVSILVFVGMLFLALSQWMFSETPLWFNVLCVVVIVLPMLALGQVAGRHLGKCPPKNSWICLVILMGVMTILAFVSGLSDGLQMLSWPGLLVGGAIGELLHVRGCWDGILPIAGNLLVPLVYHLGWCWGRAQ